MLQGSNLQPSVSAPSTRNQISSILHQALLITAIAPNTKTLSSFDHLGFDPQNLGRKKVVGWSYYDFTLAHVVLRLSDNTQLAFQSLPVETCSENSSYIDLCSIAKDIRAFGY